MGQIKHTEKSFEHRLDESTKIMQKHTDRICIFVEKSKDCDNLNDLDRQKYLVPNYLSIGQFMYVIRKRIKLSQEKALFFYTRKNNLLAGTINMIDIYNKHKDPDGFLYIRYTGENCFG
jgi:GABA(A) receptor-associated protein